MGFLALGCMLVAVIAAVMTFQIARSAWRMPTMLNLPGVFLVFSAVISLSGWLTHDLFEGFMHIPAPDVPWYSWLVYMGLAVLWYLSMTFLVAKWREAPESTSAIE